LIQAFVIRSFSSVVIFNLSLQLFVGWKFYTCVCEGYEVSWEEDTNTVSCLHTLCHSDMADQVFFVLFYFSGFISFSYLWGRQAATPAQRWGHISLSQSASLNVTIRLQ